MFRVFFLIFVVALLALPLSVQADITSAHTEPGPRQVYMLPTPIKQTVKNHCGVVGAIWGMNLTWSVSMVVGTYLCFHDPVSAGMMAAWDFSQDYFYSTAGVRSAVDFTARWQRRKDLKKIAAATGADKLRVITTGQTRQLGVLNAELSSKSFIFVEVAGDKPPPIYDGKPLIPVGNIESTKVKLQFNLPGLAKELPALELSLAEIFDGVKIPVEVENAWREGLKEWNSKLPLWDRYVTKKTFNAEARISAALIKDGEVIELGSYAKGSGIKKVLGMTHLRQARRFLDETVLGRDVRETGPHIKSQTVQVHDSAGCSKWYRRLLGDEIVVP
ncbi:MAG: hypothetical protein ACXWQO_10385 [Bdellovibrionota bacterium]